MPQTKSTKKKPIKKITWEAKMVDDLLKATQWYWEGTWVIKTTVQEYKHVNISKLTRKQKAFADEYIDNGGNGTKAALKAYSTDKDTVANAISVENLWKPLIKAYLEDYGDEAGSKIIELMRNWDKHSIQLDAAKYTYDHIHWKAIQKMIHTGDKDNPITIQDISDDTTFKQLEEMKKQLINLSKK